MLLFRSFSFPNDCIGNTAFVVHLAVVGLPHLHRSKTQAGAVDANRRSLMKPNERPGADAGWRVSFAFGRQRPRAAQAGR